MRRIAATLAVVGALLFSAGITLADDTSEANKLFVEAVKLVNSAENNEHPTEKSVALEEALQKLKQIVDDYPTSDLAVKLISGQNIGNISLDKVALSAKKAGKKAKKEVERVRREEKRAAEKVRAAVEKSERIRAFAKTFRDAKQGDADAQFNLGIMYETDGVPENDAEVAKWFRKAAEQGHVSAQYNLGQNYRRGEGVPQNDAEAVKWYRKAAEQGHAKAQYFLGAMYEKGRGVSNNNAEAVKWYRKAAEQGNAPAQYNLGFMYAMGTGVSANNVRAYMWWSLAKAQGQVKAAGNLKILRERMTPAQIGKAKALAYEWRQASSQQGSKKEEQKVDLEAERKVLNEKLTKIIMKTINWTPLEVTEGTLDNPGPPISQTCPPDVAKRIQEVSEEEFTKLLEQISGDLASEISSRITKKLNLSEARLAVDTLEEFSSWPEEDQKAFQETDLAKRIQQLVLPEINQSLNIIGQKFSQLAPGIFEKIEVRLETEGIIKVSEHNWCLQD